LKGSISSGLKSVVGRSQVRQSLGIAGLQTDSSSAMVNIGSQVQNTFAQSVNTMLSFEIRRRQTEVNRVRRV